MNPEASPTTPHGARVPLLIGVGLVLIIIVFALLAFGRRHHPTEVGTANASPEAVVQITVNGFVPSTLTVKAGTPIVWRNADTAPHSVASNPYPADSRVPGLHSATITPHGNYTYTPTAKGTIGYHDDIVPSNNGVIIVQ